MTDVTAIGRLLTALTCKEVDSAGYPIVEAHPVDISSVSGFADTGNRPSKKEGGIATLFGYYRSFSISALGR